MTNTETEFKKLANVLATGLGGLAAGAGAGYALSGDREDGETEEEYNARRLRNAGMFAVPGAAVGAAIPYLGGLKNKITEGSFNPDYAPGGKNAPEPESMIGAGWRGTRQAFIDPFISAVKGGNGIKQRLKDLIEGGAAIGVPTIATPFILARYGAKDAKQTAEAIAELGKSTGAKLPASAAAVSRMGATHSGTYAGMNTFSKIKAMLNAFKPSAAVRTGVDAERAVAMQAMVSRGAKNLKGLGLSALAFGAYPAYNAIMKGPDQGADVSAKTKEVSEAAKQKAKELLTAASQGIK
jgi:hypothetical protein